MTGVPSHGTPRAMVQNARFEREMEELDQGARREIWKSLKRARDDQPTPGVEKPWDGDWELWPCGKYRVLLRPMTREEVKTATGAAGEGIYLMYIELPSS